MVRDLLRWPSAALDLVFPFLPKIEYCRLTFCFDLHSTSELLQNSDDAEAKSVQLHFFTKAGTEAPSSHVNSTEGTSRAVPDLKTVEITRYVFKNDGQTFRPQDWDRLKKIAEGNPDDSKIVRHRPSSSERAGQLTLPRSGFRRERLVLDSVSAVCLAMVTWADVSL